MSADNAEQLKPEVASQENGDDQYLHELTPEERRLEKKLVRKIDIMIMPLVVLVYLMNYIDR